MIKNCLCQATIILEECRAIKFGAGRIGDAQMSQVVSVGCCVSYSLLSRPTHTAAVECVGLAHCKHCVGSLAPF